MAGEFQQPSQEPNANDKKQAPIILINLWEKGRRQWENIINDQSPKLTFR